MVVGGYHLTARILTSPALKAVIMLEKVQFFSKIDLEDLSPDDVSVICLRMKDRFAYGNF